MSAENENDHIDDEDTQDEMDLSDTERPPEASIRDTRPDLSLEAEAAMARRHELVETIDLSRLPRRKEVVMRICASAKIKESDLKNLGMEEVDGKLMRAEYRLENTSVGYLYVHRDCKEPRFIRFDDDARVPIKHPNATVLFEVYRAGDMKEIYRWIAE